jgi:hypothetical protein
MVYTRYGSTPKHPQDSFEIFKISLQSKKQNLNAKIWGNISLTARRKESPEPLTNAFKTRDMSYEQKEKNIIEVKGTPITVFHSKENDFISLTDIAKTKENDSRAADVIKNWIRTRSTIEFIGTWEQLYNPDFKVVKFDHFKMNAGLPSFVLSPGNWVEKTNAIGIFVKKGKYGGTFAHKDIALEFCSAINPTFKLFLIKEFQRLKEEEYKLLDWSAKRELAKINYRIHTDANKENLIPIHLSKKQISFVYANEAEVLNMALFGKTAKEWRAENPEKKGT